jgi:hypothetical protein
MRPAMPDRDADHDADPAPDDFDLGFGATARLAEAIERLRALAEGRIAPALERIAAAVERLEAVGAGTGPAPGDARRDAVAEVHEALGRREWARLVELVARLSREHPDHPETAAVAELVARRKEEAAGGLREQLDASRGANDPEGVLALRDELATLLDPAGRQELDQDLVRWLLKIIQRRMRTGTVAPDVARLAAEAAGRFGGTLEGASLRASLPTLRRSAGLSPRCGEPYDGEEDACPRCLLGAAAAAAVAPAPPPSGGGEPPAGPAAAPAP